MENSSVLMFSKRFPRYLYRWRVMLWDATNRVHDTKRQLFQRIRGPRWLFGAMLAVGGASGISQIPAVNIALSVGGVTMVLFDP